MGCFPFANYHFQMGVTAMGFAEDFGQCLVSRHLCSYIIELDASYHICSVFFPLVFLYFCLVSVWNSWEYWRRLCLLLCNEITIIVELLAENKYLLYILCKSNKFSFLTLFLLRGALLGPNNLKQSGISTVLWLESPKFMTLFISVSVWSQ